MKIKGAELQQFIDTGWPDDENGEAWYWDHEVFETPDPETTYDTDDLGRLYWQGQGEDPSDRQGLNLDTLIRRWRKARAEKTLVVNIPKDKEEEFLAFLKSIKGKVSK